MRHPSLAQGTRSQENPCIFQQSRPKFAKHGANDRSCPGLPDRALKSCIPTSESLCTRFTRNYKCAIPALHKVPGAKKTLVSSSKVARNSPNTAQTIGLVQGYLIELLKVAFRHLSRSARDLQETTNAPSQPCTRYQEPRKPLYLPAKSPEIRQTRRKR